MYNHDWSHDSKNALGFVHEKRPEAPRSARQTKLERLAREKLRLERLAENQSKIFSQS